MVNLAGHLAMALLFAAPAWLVWSRRGALGFTAFALVTSMLPDTDLVLQHYLPITHHGITHTLLFVGVASVITGALAGRFLTDWFNEHHWIRSTAITPELVFWFATAGFLTGGVSHLFADLLSAPDIAAPLSPFWPVYAEPVIIDVIAYDSVLWNFGLLAVAVATHALLARNESYPLDTRFRIGGRKDGRDTSELTDTEELTDARYED